MSSSSKVYPKIIITPPTEDIQDPYLCDEMLPVPANLLTPCQFNWADDVEESIRDAPLSVAQIRKTYQSFWPTSNAHRRRRQSSVRQSLVSINEEVCVANIKWVEENTNVESSLFKDEPQTTTPRSHGSSSIYLKPPMSDEAYVNVSPSCDDTKVYDEAREDVNKIFQYRDAWMEVKPRIHHFSWTGQYVCAHSATAPSDSLAIIMATPKNINSPKMLRVKAVVNCAFQWVDPVIVLLDDTTDDLLQLRGAKLTQACEGRVYKFYSPHGHWVEDPRDSSDDAITDFGRLGTYEARCFEIGNGFVESSTIRTLGQWVNELPFTPEKNGLPRRRTWMLKPSPLSQCETAPVPEAQQEVKSKSPQQAQRRPLRKIATCVKEEVPHVYYSFPEPEFGKSRMKAIKKALKAVFHRLISRVLA
jgi:hypothetical protein